MVGCMSWAIETVSVDVSRCIAPTVLPMEVAGNDTTSSSHANIAMARMQREAREVRVEKIERMGRKLSSREPLHSTCFRSFHDGSLAIGHVETDLVA